MENAMQTQQHQNNALAEQKPISTTSMSLNFDPRIFELAERFGNIMASGKCSVPPYLRGNKADCTAVAMQALRWGMDPFAVAPKTHEIKGLIAYEAQLVNAVVSSSNVIVGRFKYEFFGPWENVIGKFDIKKNGDGKEYQVPGWKMADEKGCGVRIIATIRGDSEPTVRSLLLSQATVRNSTLWAADPQQQLGYLGVKRWVRLHTPDVLLGVYTVDELEDVPRQEREINPVSSAPQTKSESLNKAMEDAGELSKLAVEFIRKIEKSGTLSALKTVYDEIAAAAQAGKLTQTDRAELNKSYKNAKAMIEQVIAQEQAMADGEAE